jgi:fatty-acyl-CoA synthase
MQGLMQDTPLSIIHLFDRAEKYHGDKTITTATATGLEHTDYATWAARTRRLGGVLNQLGISPNS